MGKCRFTLQENNTSDLFSLFWQNYNCLLGGCYLLSSEHNSYKKPFCKKRREFKRLIAK